MNYPDMMPVGMNLPSLMTPKDKQEQYEAIQAKLSLKSSLIEMCEKHTTQVVIFEKILEQGVLTAEEAKGGELVKESISIKYCERCFFEHDDKSSITGTSKITVGEESKTFVSQI